MSSGRAGTAPQPGRQPLQAIDVNTPRRRVAAPPSERVPNGSKDSYAAKDSGIASKAKYLESAIAAGRAVANAANRVDPLASDQNTAIDTTNADPQGPSTPHFVGNPPAVTTGTTAQRKKAKKGEAKKPFIADWYGSDKTYADTTLYHKITISGMEDFLTAEGFDVIKRLPTEGGSHQRRENNKRQRVGRTEALMTAVKRIHQRVIDRKKAGLPVGGYMPPHLGAEEVDDQDDESNEDLNQVDIDSDAAATTPGNFAATSRNPHSIPLRQHDGPDVTYFEDDTDVELDPEIPTQGSKIVPEWTAGTYAFNAAGHHERPFTGFVTPIEAYPVPESVTPMQPQTDLGENALSEVNEEIRSSAGSEAHVGTHVNGDQFVPGITQHFFPYSYNFPLVPDVSINPTPKAIPTVAGTDTPRKRTMSLPIGEPEHTSSRPDSLDLL